jgi:thymidylate synthase
MNEFDDLDSAFKWALENVLRTGKLVAPRRIDTIERNGCALRLLEPRARLVGNAERKWNVGYALGDVLWHFAASKQLSFISYYSKNWQKYSDDGLTIAGSCYGHKIFSAFNGAPSQWECARQLLNSDPDTRRCVISTYGPADLMAAASSKDVPCCHTLQFLIRNDRLCLIVYMRSNDLMFGFTYDIFLFTMLQERMALELGIPLGWYEHVVGSLHLYERDVEWAKRIVAAPGPPVGSMAKMEHIEELPHILESERILRESGELPIGIEKDCCGYWRDVVAVLSKFRMWRTKNILTPGMELMRVQDPAMASLLASLQTEK